MSRVIDDLTPKSDFNNHKSETINVLYSPYNAIGDGIADDTQAFIDAIAACKEGKKKLIIPRPSVEYKITATLLIDFALSVEMDAIAQIKFYPAAVDSVLFLIQTYVEGGNLLWGKYNFGKLVSATALNGIAIEIDSCMSKRIYVHHVQGFSEGIRLEDKTYSCLGNTIDFDLITQCETGIYLLNSTDYKIEGNLFRFNFITEGKYGIRIERASTGSLALNQFKGNAIHMTLPGCIALYFPTTASIPIFNEFDIQGFIAADNGVIIGGNYTQKAENDFSRCKDNVFRLYCDYVNTGKIKMSLSNVVYNNFQIYSASAVNGGIALQSVSGEANFNGGIAPNNNYMIVNAVIPVSAKGATITRFGYHQLLGHAEPKPIQVIPVTTAAVRFPSELITVNAFDNSPSVNREIAVRITNLADIAAETTIKFYLAIF